MIGAYRQTRAYAVILAALLFALGLYMAWIFQFIPALGCYVIGFGIFQWART